VRRCQQLTALSISTALVTISHQAAAASGPEVRHECPVSSAPHRNKPMATPLSIIVIIIIIILQVYYVVDKTQHITEKER